MSAEKVRVKIRCWPAIVPDGGFDYNGHPFLWMCPCCRWGRGTATFAEAVNEAARHGETLHPQSGGPTDPGKAHQ